MRRSRLVLGTMALTVAVWVGPAGAAGPGDSYGARAVGTVRFLDEPHGHAVFVFEGKQVVIVRDSREPDHCDIDLTGPGCAPVAAIFQRHNKSAKQSATMIETAIEESAAGCFSPQPARKCPVF